MFVLFLLFPQFIFAFEKVSEREVETSIQDTLLDSIETSPQTVIQTLPDNTKEISNLPSITTKTGATGKEVSLLRILSDSLLIATAIKTFTFPDSLQITNAYNLQYNIINNYITLDSADSIDALKPLNYKLNNIAQTKIQLDSDNNVLSVETIPKEEQTFTSPFNEQKDDITITSKPGSKLKIDTSKENKLGIQAQDTTVEVSPKDSLQKKKLIFTIKNGEIIVSEDSGYYKVEGSNVLTSFESISFKQILDKTKEVEFSSEQGFSEVKFEEGGYFIQEYPSGFTIKGLELEELTFARSFKITSMFDFNLYITAKNNNKEENFNNDNSLNKALIDLTNHKIILKGIIDYERISAKISETQLELGQDNPSNLKFDNGISIKIDGKKKAREIKPLDNKYKKIIESKKENNLITLSLDNNNLFVNADIQLKPITKEKGELFKAHTDSSLLYEIPTDISTKSLRFAKFEYLSTPAVLINLKSSLQEPAISKGVDFKNNVAVYQQSSLNSLQRLYSALTEPADIFNTALKNYGSSFNGCTGEVSVLKTEIGRYLSSLLPLLPLILLLPLGFLRKRKANLSLIIIPIIIAIIIISIAFYIFNTLNTRSDLALSQEASSIKDSINSCYEKTLKCGIYKLSVNTDTFTSEANLQYPRSILRSFVKGNINSCIKSLNNSRLKIYDPQDVNIIFNKDYTKVTADHLIEVIGLRQTQRLNKFEASVNLRIDEIFSTIKRIKSSSSKDIPLTLLSDAQLNAEIYDLGKGIVYILVDKSKEDLPFKFMFVKETK